MAELEWEELTEVLGSMEAELLKLYFKACDIELETFEEATTASVATVTFGRVRVYVEKKNAKEARKLLEEYENKTE
jgi:hypothetical protein